MLMCIVWQESEIKLVWLRYKYNMNIRNSIKRDLDDICNLSDQINNFHYQHVPGIFSKPTGSEKEREFWSERLSQDDALFLVVEVDDRVQGYITARLTENTIIPFLIHKKVCRVGTIVVAETVQGNGIGRAMMRKIEQWAMDNKADEIRLEVMEFNKGAHEFYDSLGFGVTSRILSKLVKK